ncbi:MAG TPA: methyltransferase domain-containing protein [Symbiobacteriaceae bacterium]|nr:methyltransferase domain-containing protein [Symbiobacteriaceae bacterium]
MQTYDDVYRQPGYYWGVEPNGLARRVTDLVPAGSGLRAIDLGAGEGRDAIHFARHGLTVTAMDLSLPGLEKAARWAAEEGLPLRTLQGSLADFRLTEPYEIVYASGVVTYIPPDLRAEVFANYKEMTPAGGIHAFNAFVEKPFIPVAPDWGADEYHFRSGDLLRFYWDWEIIHFAEFIFDCNSSGVPHRHAMDVLIARKV